MSVIKIVRLKHLHREATVPPRLTYRGGPLIQTVNVTTIFWGSQWSDDTLRTRIDAFFDYIVASPLIDQLSEYNVAGFEIERGVHSTSAGIGGAQPDGTVLDPDPPATIDDATIQSQIEDWILQNRFLGPPTPDSLYFLFLPQGVTVTMQGAASCKQFCGYHDVTPQGHYYAVIPYPDCPGCAFTPAVLDSITTIASHELCEAITDPIPGRGWYDDANGEIGDICETAGTKLLNGYTVQLEWSNSKGGCI